MPPMPNPGAPGAPIRPPYGHPHYQGPVGARPSYPGPPQGPPAPIIGGPPPPGMPPQGVVPRPQMVNLPHRQSPGLFKLLLLL